MGFDKAQLNFHGVDQVTWLHDLLSPYCEKVFVSGSPLKIKGNYNFIEDVYDRGGPMNGILSAFKKFPDRSWLIVPVDMPNIRTQAIDLLVQSHHSKFLATSFINPESKVEPLPLITNARAYPVLLKFFLDGKESLAIFLREQRCLAIKIPDVQWLKNVNVPSQI